MNKVAWQRIFIVAAVLFFFLIAWLGRYTIIGISPGGEGIHGIAYRLDRWTGEVVWMHAPNGGVIVIKN
jgi:hypothetical protein